MGDLYVFYVNRGYIFQLDFAVSLKTVKNLQEYIQDLTCVLLSPTGVNLESDKSVQDYIKTEQATRPIYLFNKSSRSDREEMSVSQEKEAISRNIYSLLEVGDGYIRQRTDRYGQYHRLIEHSHNCVKIAESTVQASAAIVQEHINLNGGWQALVANLSEALQRLEKKQRRYEHHNQMLENMREKAKELFEGFDESLEQLKKIKIPHVLLPRLEKEVTLYEWITSFDPNHSLQDLVKDVRKQLEIMDALDQQQQIAASLRSVKEMVVKPDNKEIRGINKRINQIEHSLTVLSKHKEMISQTAQQQKKEDPRTMDETTLSDIVVHLQGDVSSIHDLLRRICESCVLFFKSKGEILENIRARLSGWVVQAYERMHVANCAHVIFEEKFTGLKQRLDLFRQVKDTPLLFASCVTEIMRRNNLQKEFQAWHATHLERCVGFSSEENQLRNVFAKKLEHHFLRLMFHGMFDKMPIFYVKRVPEFDTALPSLDMEYYKDLRQNVGTIESVLRLTSPQVHQRLSGRPTSLTSHASRHDMRREESFISYEQPEKMATNLHNAFPSSAWLVDEGMDMSPCPEPNLIVQMQSPSGERERHPFHAGQRLPSLHDIHEQVETSEMEEDGKKMHGHTYKSAPISIPMSFRKIGEQPNASASRLTTSEEGLNDSKEDKDQFGMDDISTRSQMLEVLGPMNEELHSLNKDLADTKSELEVYRNRFDIDVQEVLQKTERKFGEIMEAKDAQQAHELKAAAKELETSMATIAERDKQISDLQRVIETKEETIAGSDAILAERNQDIARLEDAKVEADKAHEEETKENFKRLTIEFELVKDREASDFRQTIEEKEDEIRQLKKELERKIADIEKLKHGPGSEDFRKVIETDVRGAVDKEMKNKVELLSKGFEQKRDEAIKRKTKELEFEFKHETIEKDLKLRSVALERDLFKTAWLHPAEAVFKTIETITEHVAHQMDTWALECRAPSSLYMSSSPRPSPRKPFGIDSLHASITSLTSPVPSTPPEDHAMAGSESSNAAPSRENSAANLLATSTPEISPPADGKLILPPEPSEREAKTPEPTPTEKVSKDAQTEPCKATAESESSSDSSDSNGNGRSSGEFTIEKRAEKRRSTERAEEEDEEIGRKTMIMEESFIPGHTMPPILPSLTDAPIVEESDTLMESMSAEMDDGQGHVSIGIQTRIALKAMEYMVSLSDIREGMNVLVVWDERHNAYILFCLSNFIHFVKETSVKRLGLTNVEELKEHELPRKNWILARVSHIDLCLIKKPTNRYKLPVETQVYRVDVYPVTFDSEKTLTIPSSRKIKPDS